MIELEGGETMSELGREILLFKIDAFRPETLPMARLAEYLAGFAALLGNRDRVHFDKVRKGSALLQAFVDVPARVQIAERLAKAVDPDAPDDLRSAYTQLDDMLRIDNATGQLRRAKGAVILNFPGRKRSRPEIFTVWQTGELLGTVVRVGGRGDTIPVWLEDVSGREYNCYTRSRSLAKDIAVHLFGAPLRVSGNGKWRRNGEGVWEVEQFDVTSYELVSDSPLKDSIAAVRAVPNNKWNTIEDSDAELRRIRSGE